MEYLCADKQILIVQSGLNFLFINYFWTDEVEIEIIEIVLTINDGD